MRSLKLSQRNDVAQVSRLAAARFNDQNSDSVLLHMCYEVRRSLAQSDILRLPEVGPRVPVRSMSHYTQ
jgi:hypothetical protein